MADYTVVINDCAAPPVIGLTHIRTKQTAFGPRSVDVDYSRIAQGLAAPLTPIQQDWAEVLGYIYAIDLTCPRGDGDNWQREIDAWIPVRDPALWQRFAPELVRIFGSLTYDRLSLTFVADSDPTPAPRQTRAQLPEASGVALLSGGLDSFVGAAVLLAEHEKPLFVSHKNSGAAGHAVNSIAPTLRTRGAPADPLTITARRAGSGEGSQRARTMLYMGLSCLLAVAHCDGKVWLNENGVMAVHVPLTEARTGSFSTRTASPDIVARFERLATAVLGASVSISNVLLRSTKPEVTEIGNGLGVHTEMVSTVSCWSIGRSSVHCGYCAPCLVRRTGFEWLGLGDAHYRFSPMDQLPTGAERATALDNLSQMTQLAVSLHDENDDDTLLMEYTELLNVGPGLTVEESIQMHRRWADQFLTVAATHPESAKML